MMRFEIAHKYCGYTKTIEGDNVYEAFKKNGLDLNVWVVKNIEKIKKVLDKRVKVCYNNYGERERTPKAKYIKRGN